MTTWRPDFNPDHLYFVTISVVHHYHFFRRDVMKRLVVDCLDCIRLRGRLKLFCFVVMPSHIHLIVQCRADDPLADVIRDLKKHVADRVVRQYRAEHNQAVLDLLVSAVERQDKQKHRMWEEGYEAKDVFSPEFLRQKMTYIHNSPCQDHWRLVEHPEEYIWSSARFYLLEETTIIPLDSANDLLV